MLIIPETHEARPSEPLGDDQPPWVADGIVHQQAHQSWQAVFDGLVIRPFKIVRDDDVCVWEFPGAKSMLPRVLLEYNGMTLSKPCSSWHPYLLHVIGK